MRITKHEHSCLVLDQGGSSLVIDPGNWTTLLVGTNNVRAIVITHEHADHWTADQLEHILKQNPDARIFGPQGVVDAAHGFKVEAVSAGDTVEVEPFTLRFFGGEHAVIHSSVPVVDNVGVLVNDLLYYAGDSFTVPEGVEVDTLAVPAAAPWMKIAEAMDFVAEVKPRRSFTVHEMVLSKAGKDLSNARVKLSTEAVGGEFFPLEPGEELDI